MRGFNHGGVREGSGRPKAAALVDALRCTYVRPDGSRCGNSRTRHTDTERCRFHGGQTKVAKARQDEALVASVMVLMDRHIKRFAELREAFGDFEHLL